MIEQINNRMRARLLRGLDKSIYELLVKYKGFIAGGAILSIFTGKKINDYDLYFLTNEDANNFTKDLKLVDKKTDWAKFGNRERINLESYKNKINIFETDNSVTFIHKGQKYQIINAFYLPMEELFNKYDFTVCMAAYDVLNEKFLLHDRFLMDATEKRLVFNIGTEYPICSLLRVLKYQKKGYNINGLELIKMSLTIHKLNLENYGELKKQLQGIDTLFLKELTDTLSSPEYKERKFIFEEFLQLFDAYIERNELAIFKDYNEDPEE
jgi:hypothetical protein